MLCLPVLPAALADSIPRRPLGLSEPSLCQQSPLALISFSQLSDGYIVPWNDHKVGSESLVRSSAIGSRWTLGTTPAAPGALGERDQEQEESRE